MSMICFLRQVPDAEINRLMATPGETHIFLFGPHPLPQPGFFARLFGKKAPTPPQWTPPADGEKLDLDKSWHGIHYLLTGEVGDTDSALSFLLTGTEIGEDIGYGPARAFHAAQVRAIQTVLQPLTPETLRAHYNPADMNEQGIYPDIWDKGDEPLEYLLENYATLKSFIDECVAKDRGLIIYLI